MRTSSGKGFTIFWLLIGLVVLFSLVMFRPEGTLGFSGCEEGCEKCHTISADEINVILKKIKAPDAKILKTQMSPVKGLWEVSIEHKGRGDVLYVDFSKKFLIAGSIVEVDASLNKTKERIDELNKDRKVDVSAIPLKEAVVIGLNTAPRKVIVFTDPD